MHGMAIVTTLQSNGKLALTDYKIHWGNIITSTQMLHDFDGHSPLDKRTQNSKIRLLAQ